MRKILHQRGGPFLLAICLLSLFAGILLIYEIFGTPEAAEAAADLQPPDIIPPPIELTSAKTTLASENDKTDKNLNEKKPLQTYNLAESNEPKKMSESLRSLAKNDDPKKLLNQTLSDVTKSKNSSSSSNESSEASHTRVTQNLSSNNRGIEIVPPPPINNSYKDSIANTQIASSVASVSKVISKSDNITHSNINNSFTGHTAEPSLDIKNQTSTSTTKITSANSSITLTNSASYKKPKKHHVSKRVSEPVPTEIPPEWNWFSYPLEVIYIKGHYQIISKVKQEISSQSLDASIKSVNNTYNEIDHLSDIPVQNGNSIPQLTASNTTQNIDAPLFNQAYKRMLTLKEKREKEANKFNFTLPSQSGKMDYVPQSIQKMHKKVEELIGYIRNNETAAINIDTTCCISEQHYMTNQEFVQFAPFTTANKDSLTQTMDISWKTNVSNMNYKSSFGQAIHEILSMNGFYEKL